MPEPGLERDLNLKGAAVFVAPFSCREFCPCLSLKSAHWFRSNDVHKNKDLKVRRLSPFKRDAL